MIDESDDTALMSRYRAGDVAAFEALYARHKGPLYRYLLHRCRPRNAAADVFQEVWGRVIANRERYEVRASFKTYLYRIAHHCAIDHHRARARKRTDQMDSIESHGATLATADCDGPDAQTAQAQLESAFRRALAELPEEQREVFVLFEESGLGMKEIAEITGVPAETIKSRLRYALAKLRRALTGKVDAAGLEPVRVRT